MQKRGKSLSVSNDHQSAIRAHDGKLRGIKRRSTISSANQYTFLEESPPEIGRADCSAAEQIKVKVPQASPMTWVIDEELQRKCKQECYLISDGS